MRRASLFSTGLWSPESCCPLFACCAQDQNDAREQNIQGNSLPRACRLERPPTEYQSQTKAGMVTIGAEFMGHSVPTPEQPTHSEDYVVVEAGLFGPAGAKTTLSRDDFSLRINGKKTLLPSEPYELVFHSLKDPEWQPPESPDQGIQRRAHHRWWRRRSGRVSSAPASQNAVPAAPRNGTAGSKGCDGRRRPSAAAGWIAVLQYHGKPERIKSLELVYSGAAGKVTLILQP